MKLNIFANIVDTTTFTYDTLSNEFAESLLSSTDGTLGLEWYITKDKVRKYLFSQKESLELERKPKLMIQDDLKELSCYSLNTYKPMCFPFRMQLEENILTFINKYVEKVLTDEKVIIQILLKKVRAIDWQIDSKHQYLDYINGIELPTKNKVVRLVQNRILEFLQNKEEFLGRNPMIEGAERKFTEEGYETYIRFAIYGGNKEKRNQLAAKVKLGFSTMNYSNSWIMNSPMIKSSFISDINLRRFPLVPTQLILCVSELLPLFSSVVEDKAEEAVPISLIAESNIESSSSPYAIFPKGEKLVREDDTNIEQKINKAFKKLRLIAEQKIKVKGTQHGSTVRKVTFTLPEGLKLSHLTSDKTVKDIQTELALTNIAIEQGREASTVSLILPQEEREKVFIRDCLETSEFQKLIKSSELPFIVGVGTIGEIIFNDLTKVKHLLVVGATGSGKSVFLNGLLVTMLMLKNPKQLQMLLIDPKQVELTGYKNYPHVIDVITDNRRATLALMKMVIKMNERYEILSKKGYKNIQQYNSNEKDNPLPYIIIVVDELADLIMSVPAVEDSIVMLAQKARAAGIHLIIATQKPIVDVVTSLIKGNIYSRVCFLCDGSSSYHVALDKVPDFELLGDGDGVIRFEGIQGLVRFQGALIGKNDDEDRNIIEHLSTHWKGKWVKETLDLDDVSLEDAELIKLKCIILETGETKVTALAKLIKVRSEKVTDMMMELVDQEWLVKHKSRAKGYELILNEEQRKVELAKLK